jgi:hypothetical protein
MKQGTIAILIIIAALWAGMTVMPLIVKGKISKSTEEKYLRNIGNFKVSYGRSSNEYFLFAWNDSLTSIHKMPLSITNPFAKYHIGDDVGYIPRGSRLHKIVDSLLSGKDTPSNPYK